MKRLVNLNGMLGLLCLIWGFNWVIMKLANGVFPPVLFAGYRFGLGAIVLLAFCLYKKVPFPKGNVFVWIAVCGFLQTTYFNIAIQLSLKDLSAGLTSVLTYSMPLWLSVMGHFWLPGERLTVRKSIGVLLGTGGLFLALDAHWGGNFGSFILALSSGVAWALSNVIIKRKLRNCDNLQFTTWQMTVGAVGLLLYSVCLEHGESHSGVLPLVYVGFAGIIGSAFAFVLWFRILANMEAGKASISLLLVPVIGVLSGYLVLGESLQLLTAAGILLILAGIWLVNSVNRKIKAPYSGA
jgi:O-acetylserine/cysteine efflux transporter